MVEGRGVMVCIECLFEQRIFLASGFMTPPNSRKLATSLSGMAGMMIRIMRNSVFGMMWPERRAGLMQGTDWEMH